MYITEGDLEKYILQDIDSSYSGWITTIIGFVEAYIDQYCSTSFANLGTQTKYYDGTGSTDLFIDAFQEITSVQILDTNGSVQSTLTLDNDYYSYPLNDSIQNRLQLSGNSLITHWPNRTRAVKIVGTFGYDTVPDPIKFAAIQLASKIINEGLRGGQVKSENLGSYSITYRDIDETSESMGIKEILNQYREMRLL